MSTLATFIQHSIEFLITATDKKRNHRKLNSKRKIENSLFKDDMVTYIENLKNITQEEIPCSWIGRINVIKMTILSKAIYRLNAMTAKLTMSFFTELEEIILKFVWKHTHTKYIIAKIIINHNRAGGIILPDFKIY